MTKQYGKAARKAQMKQRVVRKHACTEAAKEATKIAREKQLRIDDEYYRTWERHRMGWPWQLEVSGFASSFMEDPYYMQYARRGDEGLVDTVTSIELERLKDNLYKQFAKFCVDKGIAKLRDETHEYDGMTMHTLSIVADFYPDRRRINWPEDTDEWLFESRKERLNAK